jgi:type II secretory ATPase GspE/PulE/Tfp pilus assembly ATPase PilB-like protein
MPDLLASSIEVGGYVSIIKLIIFLGLFFPLLPVLCWIYNDAEILEERSVFWITIILSIAAAAIIIWILVPFFIIGMLFYIIAVGASTYAYIKVRNALVMESERVLTSDHFKRLFTRSEDKELKGDKKFIFITANKNEVPVPEPKTPDYHGYKTAYQIFSDAMWRRVANIVFLPGAEGYNFIYNIDGIATKQPAMSKEQAEYFIRFAKQLSNLDINEKRKPQKGKFKIRKDKNDNVWEVITAGSTAGEQVQINLKSQQGISKLEELNLIPEQFAQMAEIRNIKQGVFIVSGTPKSGLTTTFYTLLRNHDGFLNNIHTLERDKAGDLPNITQEVFTPSGSGMTTFAGKLETIIRMGPDIVGVSGCNDKESASLCCGAARDNKLVYVAMEADSVMAALTKWIKLVDDPSDSLGTLVGITNQRLVRKLCDECKEAYEPDQELLKKFNIPKDAAKAFYRAGKVQYDKHGKPVTCENCQGTGYVGRIPVLEIIRVNDQIRKSIINLKSLSEIARQFRAAKMLYMQEQMLKRVLAGVTSVNEMVRVLSKPKSDEKK